MAQVKDNSVNTPQNKGDKGASIDYQYKVDVHASANEFLNFKGPQKVKLSQILGNLQDKLQRELAKEPAAQNGTNSTNQNHASMAHSQIKEIVNALEHPLTVKDSRRTNIVQKLPQSNEVLRPGLSSSKITSLIQVLTENKDSPKKDSEDHKPNPEANPERKSGYTGEPNTPKEQEKINRMLETITISRKLLNEVVGKVLNDGKDVNVTLVANNFKYEIFHRSRVEQVLKDRDINPYKILIPLKQLVDTEKYAFRLLKDRPLLVDSMIANLKEQQLTCTDSNEKAQNSKAIYVLTRFNNSTQPVKT